METLFRWIHISDIHIGHGDAAYGWDQRLVLDALKRDVAQQVKTQPDPPVDVILVTGDIANTGAGRRPTEYEEAAAWLNALGEVAGVPAERIFVVPGNHDVDRSADKDPAVKDLVFALRDGKKGLDDALGNLMERAMLSKRMERYLAFARQFAPPGADPLLWVHRMVARSGLPVRLVGLNTALLAADDQDFGKLRVGLAQLGQALLNVKEGELVMALGHHPLRGGWVADETEIEPYLKRNVHALLTGHVHEADSEASRSGAGGSFLRLAAGSAHGDKMPKGIPAGHGYSLGAVVRDAKGQASVRVWPRKWSAKNATFKPDVDNIPDGEATFADHPLPASLARTPGASAAPQKVASKPGALRVDPSEPLPVFISCAMTDNKMREELQKQLTTLRRQKKVTVTHSQDAPGGDERQTWIRERVDEARMVILLLSRDYIASDAAYEDEMTPALERAKRGEVRVIPILLKNFDFATEPFEGLEPLPRNIFADKYKGRWIPIEQYPKGRDEAWTKVAEEITDMVYAMRGEPPPKRDRYR